MPNPHVEQAKKRLHNGTNNEVARAQAEATLALAFEQARTADALETANLIAYTALAGRMNPGEFPTADLQALINRTMRDIETRIGLA